MGLLHDEWRMAFVIFALTIGKVFVLLTPRVTEMFACGSLGICLDDWTAQG